MSRVHQLDEALRTLRLSGIADTGASRRHPGGSARWIGRTALRDLALD